MFIEVSSAAFQKAISFIASIQRQKADGLDSSPNILLSASSKKGVLLLEAFAAGMYVKSHVECNVLEEGQVSIDYAHLTGLKLTSATVKFRFGAQDEQRMIMQCGRFKAALAVSPDTITDKRPMEKIVLNHHIPFEDISRGVRTVSFRSLDVTSKLNCLISLSGKVMKVYSHDPYRGSIYKCKNPCQDCDPLTLLIPLDIIQKLLAAVPQKESDISVYVGTNGKMLRLKSSFFDIYHPAIDAELLDVGKNIAAMQSEADSIVVTTAFNIKAAQESVASVSSLKGNAGELIANDLVITDDGVVAARSVSSVGNAISKFDTKISSIKGQKVAIPVNFTILNEIFSLLAAIYKNPKDDFIDMTVIDDNIILCGRSSGWRATHVFSQAEIAE